MMILVTFSFCEFLKMSASTGITLFLERVNPQHNTMIKYPRNLLAQSEEYLPH